MAQAEDARQPSAVRDRSYPPPPRREPLWPALATVVAAIALQLLLPKRVTAGPRWMLPAFEAVLLVGLFFASPRELEHEHRRRRVLALGLTALVSLANISSLALL
ncbi:MAG TPA: hypothetical protein VGG87_08250, partial [Solirubrobacteraceae bacterium]